MKRKVGVLTRRRSNAQQRSRTIGEHEISGKDAVKAEIGNLRILFGSQNRIAELLGVDRSSVTRWIKGQDLPDSENEEKIIAIRYVLSRLTRIFQEEVAMSWLKGINAFLGNQRPIDLLRNGRVSEVIAAIEQTETGAYA